MALEEVVQQMILQLEGPYKWYVLFFIIAVITALVTRFIFKTLKWFLLLAAFGLIIFYVWSQLLGRVDTYLPSGGVGEARDQIENLQLLEREN